MGTGRSESAEQRHFTASGTLSVFLRYKPIWILTEIIVIVIGLAFPILPCNDLDHIKSRRAEPAGQACQWSISFFPTH